jgi:cell fate regulator YaaT (PSP1 superfamily)
MPIQLDLMPVEEKLPDTPPPKTIVVRYGYLREIGEFPSDLTQKVGCGTKLVLRTERGTEIGEMLTTVCGNGGCSKSITRDKLLSYIENSGGRDYPFSEGGRVLRPATTQDLAEQARLDEDRTKHVNLARELVQRHNLPMKIVDVEHLLGGERVLFYFVSEQRVDFRSLVRDLAHALHTRIELRQVGARDEARITADYEKCGQHCCCKQFLKVLTPISMRSAKVQKATLDPTKISGRCGRLMCCLRYEDETYEELRKKLPKRNTRVKTEKGDGWVLDGQILTQLVLVQFDDGKREAVPMEKILGFDQPKPVMSDGRTMQTPNDRPPMDMPMGRRGPGGPGAPGGPGGGPAGGPGRRERPRPGMPAQGPAGDPLAQQGPTGGDLNTGGDEIDDLIADAMDDGGALQQASDSTASVEGTPLPPVAPADSDELLPPLEGGPASAPPAGPWQPRNAPGRGPGGPRGNRGPGGAGGPAGGPRPPQDQGGNRGQGNRQQGQKAGGGNRPQGFRPPKPQGQRPPGGPPGPGIPPSRPPMPSSPESSVEANRGPLTDPESAGALPPTPPPPPAPSAAGPTSPGQSPAAGPGAGETPPPEGMP